MRGLFEHYPMAVASDSVENILHKHRDGRRWIYWLILAGVFSALLCLPVVHVDVMVSAPGMVRPIHEKVVLRTHVSDRIAQVLVEDNESVQRGQALIYFDSREVDERITHLENQIIRHAALHDDLAGLLRRLSPSVSHIWADMATEKNNKVGGFHILKAGEAVEIPYLRAEIERLRAQLVSRSLVVNKARRTRKRYDALAAKGLVSAQEHEDARMETLALEAEAILIFEQSITHWQAQLREEEDALAALRSEMTRAIEEKKGYVLRAPIDGVVIGFTGWSPGAYVQAGQVFGTISPEANLVVESYLEPRNIGLVTIGQKVRLQIDSFPYTQWGTLVGTVVDVGADLSSEVSGALFCKVSIKPEETALILPNGEMGELLKGMTVVARYQVGRRSLLQIIYQESSVWLNPYRNVESRPS